MYRKQLTRKRISLKDQETHMSCGGAKARLYPWTPPQYHERSKALIDSRRAELKHYSTKFQLQSSKLGAVPGGLEGSACLGLFAKKNIQAGDVVLSAPHLISASGNGHLTRCSNCHIDLLSTSKSSLPCCTTTRFCTDECRDIAIEHFHKAMCGRSFDEVRASRKTSKDERGKELILLQILAICVQAKCHPLQNPTVARLAPQYMGDHGVPWSLRGNIVAPIEYYKS